MSNDGARLASMPSSSSTIAPPSVFNSVDNVESPCSGVAQFAGVKRHPSHARGGVNSGRLILGIMPMVSQEHDVKMYFEKCAALRVWRITHKGALPKRRIDNDDERSLASWLSRALQRRQRALGDCPSQRQLTRDEATHLDSIVCMDVESCIDVDDTCASAFVVMCVEGPHEPC